MIMLVWLTITMAPINPLAWFIIDAAMKGAVVFGLAAVAMLAMGRQTAAARHLVWVLAAGAAVVLPVFSASLPAWELRLPAQAASRIAGADPVGGGGSSPTLVPAPRTAHEPLAPQPLDANERGGKHRVAAAPSARAPSVADVPRPRMILGWRWVPWVWAAGAIVSVLSPVAGLLSLWRLGRAARPLIEGPAPGLLTRLAAALALNRPVRLVQSGERTMPMTWGVWYPVVLLPCGSRSWCQKRLEMVLWHELAHVQRCDFVTGLLGHVACALYWFNPLAWLAATRIRIEQERACDDLVLGRGLDPSEYADHLLAVLSGGAWRRPTHVIASAMASAGPIERRLRSIVDPSRARSQRPLARRRVVLAALAVVCLVLPLASGRPRLAAGAPPDEGTAQARPRDEGRVPAGPADEQADVLEQLRRNYVKPPDEAALREGALKGMVSALHDPYSTYLAPADLAELETQTRGSLTGIGARLGTSDGRVLVETPLPGSPAQKAGILPGDVILEVDGTSISGLDLRAVAKRIAGPAGTVVRLKIAHKDGREAALEITRIAITIPTVRGLNRSETDQKPALIDPEHKIGYAQVVQFGASTPVELRDSIQELQVQGMKGLILDLRSCPGGMLEAAVGVASLFLRGGVVVTVRGRDGAETVTNADERKSLGDFPLVVLINEQTASAAEIVVGALQDRGRAVLVGTRTFGKGSVQSLIKLKEGSGAIKLTTAYYTLPSGRNIDRVDGNASWGVDPNDGDFVPMETRQLERLRNPRLEQAQAGAIDPADPQLAAGLKAVVARLTTGEFTKVGQADSALAAHVHRREEVEKRRSALLDELKKVDNELKDLARAEPR
jgi:carboxyl-terminal processing protease